MDRSEHRPEQSDAGERSATKPRKKPYEPPRVLTDEAFEQISLACSTKHGTHKNFT